jgi:type I restriction enzyme, S subunit
MSVTEKFVASDSHTSNASRSVEEKMRAGWSLLRLGEVCKTATGGTPSRKFPEYFQGDVPWVKSGELPDGIIIENQEFISEKAIQNSNAKVFPAGTLLIALYGATVGKLGILSKAAATNQAISAIFPPTNINSKYLFWYLRSIRADLVAQAVGGAQPNISQGIIRNLLIPIAPFDQQKRIVAEIEKQFSRLDEAVANLKRVKANLKRYKAAVLKAAVEGRLVAKESGLPPREWEKRPIEVAIESLDQGWSPRCESEPATSDEDWAVIKTTAVQSLQYLELENKKLPANLKPRPHLELKAGDLLITRAGPRSRVGVACLVRSTRPRIMLCDKVYRLRVKQGVATPAFLELILNSPDMVDALNELKTGISDSGVNLTQQRFQELLVPIPSAKGQKRTIDEVDRCLSLVRGAEFQVDANLRRAERLRQSVLSDSFNGRRFK